MKKLITLSLTALAALALVFSCTKVVVVELTVSPLAVNYEVAGGEKSVSITCNDAWKVSCSADWITLSATSGNGNGTLKITATENKSIERREADVKISAGEVQHTVKVAQLGKTPVLTVEPATVSATVEGGQFEVAVTSNVEWTLTVPEAAAEWVSADKTSGENNGTVKLTVAPNEAFEAREAELTLAGGKLTQVLKVAQVGLEPVLIVDPEAFETDDKAAEFELAITSNLAWTVTIPEEAAWITADKLSGEGNGVVKFTLAANETIEDRETTLAVKGGNFAFEIPVSQLGQEPALTLDKTSLEAPYAGETFEVTVTSNMPWTVSIPEDATWITVDKAEGEGNGTVKLTVEQNIFLTGRNAVVTFVATEELFVELPVSQSLAPASHASDSLALVKIYTVADGANWKESRRWDLEKPIEEWPGIKLNEDGRVIECSITNGTVSTVEWELPEEIANLTELQTFQAVGSKVKGTIPEFLYGMTKLTKLRLNTNAITGSLSSKISQLTNLTELFLNGNKEFGGSIPAEIGSLKKLNNFNMAETAISGAVPAELSGCESLATFVAYKSGITSLPDNLDQWPALKTFMIYGNNIEGPLPESLAKSKTITSAQMYSCNFTGNIPASYGDLPSTCNQLYLNGNKLRGVVPAAVQAHPNFNVKNRWNAVERILPQQDGYGLYLEYSRQTDSLALVAIYNASKGAEWAKNQWDLTTPIDTWNAVTVTDDRVTAVKLSTASTITEEWELPEEVGMLSEVTDFRVNGNKLKGSIPESIYDLSKLQKLYFQNNNLSGTLSSNLGKLTELTELYIDRNVNLGGSIPASIGNLTKLASINIAKTGIGGAIPQELAKCTALKNFMAYENKLSGEIPDFWDKLPNVGVLQLYGNDGITGPIPATIGTLKKATGIQLKNCNLTGNIPASFGGLEKCGNLQLNGNKLSGVVPAEVQAHAKWLPDSGWKYEVNILPQQDGYGLTLE